MAKLAVESKSWRSAALAAALALSVATPAIAAPDASLPDPQKRFIDAISDAAVPTPGKIDDHLIPIRRDNAGLKWESAAPDARVKVVSWMSESAFQRFYAEPAALPMDKTAPPNWNVVVWVTAVPQVQDFC